MFHRRIPQQTRNCSRDQTNRGNRLARKQPETWLRSCSFWHIKHSSFIHSDLQHVANSQAQLHLCLLCASTINNDLQLATAKRTLDALLSSIVRPRRVGPDRVVEMTVFYGICRHFLLYYALLAARLLVVVLLSAAPITYTHTHSLCIAIIVNRAALVHNCMRSR